MRARLTKDHTYSLHGVHALRPRRGRQRGLDRAANGPRALPARIRRRGKAAPRRRQDEARGEHVLEVDRELRR